MRLLLVAAALLLFPFAASAASKKHPAAPTPDSAPPAPPNITDAMTKSGCKSFADLILSTPDAASTFQGAADGGITVFCPGDGAVKSFLPHFKNLSADAKLSILLYHAVPIYFSMQSLKSNNGVMNTLATDGTAKNYNFTVQNEGDVVTLKTAAAGAARITSTVLDNDPIAVYKISDVLEPPELFKPVEAPAPAPEAPAADAPKAGKGKKHATADAPGPAEDDAAPADQKPGHKKGAAVGAPVVRWFTAAAASCVAAAILW